MSDLGSQGGHGPTGRPARRRGGREVDLRVRYPDEGPLTIAHAWQRLEAIDGLWAGTWLIAPSVRTSISADLRTLPVSVTPRSAAAAVPPSLQLLGLSYRSPFDLSFSVPTAGALVYTLSLAIKHPTLIGGWLEGVRTGLYRQRAETAEEKVRLRTAQEQLQRMSAGAATLSGTPEPDVEIDGDPFDPPVPPD